MGKKLKCEMRKECEAEVTHIDDKGFIYCWDHGQERRQYRRCRELKDHEIKTLQSGKPLGRYE